MTTLYKLLVRVCLAIIISGCLASTSVSHPLEINGKPVEHAHYYQDGVATPENDANQAGHHVSGGDRHPRRPVYLIFRWRSIIEVLAFTGHPGRTKIEAPTFEYNCHGYTFHIKEGWPKSWTDDPETVLKEGHYVEIPKKFSHHWDSCDVVVYRKGNGAITHSGHVIEVVNGKITKMRSKWGFGPLVEHTPEDVPAKYTEGGGGWEVRRKCGMCINEYKCVGPGAYHVNERVKVIKVTGASNVSEGQILEKCTVVDAYSGSVKVIPVEGGKFRPSSASNYDCPGDYTAYMDIIHGSYTIEEYGTCDTTEHCGGYTPLADFWIDITPDTFVTTVEVTHDTVENYTTIYNFPESPHDIVYSPRVGPDSGDCFTLSPGWTVEIASSGIVPCGEPNDNGGCDTLYKEVLPGDEIFDQPGPDFVRIPLYVTHDNPNPVDSIDGFVIPLCFTHTNTSKYCSLSQYWNTTSTLWILPDFNRSIFRHLVEGTDTLHRNRMADMAADFSGRDWDTRILNLDGYSQFWLSMVATGSPDQLWWEGSRVLLATMTFKLEDTTTICIDSCFWPPIGQLWFSRSDAVTYVPRHFFPQCEAITQGICGDCTGDEIINVGDIVFLVSYLYKSGLAPDPVCIGDVNCDSIVNIGDIVYLVSYLYKSGPAPCPDCCSGKRR